MKKIATLVLISLMVLLNNLAIAQKLIALQSGDKATFYTDLDTALYYAKNGDDIYLPGGYIKANSTTFKIDKAVNIIGVGYNLYANPATENTIIQSQTIQIMPYVNGGSLSGICAKNGQLQIDNNVSNFNVNRCLFNVLSMGVSNVGISPSNISIIETVVYFNIQGLQGADSAGPQNVTISNSIIGDISYNSKIFISDRSWENMTCKNSILIGYSDQYNSMIDRIMNSLFENCVILDKTNQYPAGNLPNTFRNCIFTSSSNKWDPALNINCIFDQDRNSIFIDPQGFTFNMKNNYRLQDSSPGKNAGKDGTDIGIYGGRYPWKEGSLPGNPHIETFDLAGKTDSIGNLRVKIKVAAQEN